MTLRTTRGASGRSTTGSPAARPLIVGLLLFGSACRSDTNIVAKAPEVEEETPEEVEAVTEPFTADWGQWLSLGVMPSGTPAAAYYNATDGAAGFALGTMAADGSVSWAHEKPDGYAIGEGADPGDVGDHMSMAIAADGTVWLAYRDRQNQFLRYAQRDSRGFWTTGAADRLDGSGVDGGLLTSIAIDASGNPVIAHYDRGSGHLRVARWTGTAFEASIVDEGTAPEAVEGEEAVAANTGLFPDIEIVNGVEYIAYYDKANGDLKLATGTGGTYSVETVASEGDVGQWPDMVIDDGTIHIAWHDITNNDLVYTSGEPGSWTHELVDGGDFVGADAALSVNGSAIQVVYFDGFHNDMKRAVATGDGWTTETVTGDQGALGFHNELITVGGARFAGCYDYTNRTLWFDQLD
jgi:hypothetical protein